MFGGVREHPREKQGSSFSRPQHFVQSLHRLVASELHVVGHRVKPLATSLEMTLPLASDDDDDAV